MDLFDPAPGAESETASLLAAGIAKEEAGRSFEQLATERDAKLVAAMRALREAGS